MDFDAADLLSAVDTTIKTARRRAAGSTIDDHGARLRRVPTGAPPVAAQPVQQPTPEAEPSPAREQAIECAKVDLAQLSDRPPLHATETNAPDRHDGLAKRRSSQRWLWPPSHRPHTILGRGRKFCQHFVDKNVDIGNASHRPGDVSEGRTAPIRRRVGIVIELTGSGYLETRNSYTLIDLACYAA